jgi:gamma-glutamylcyclotransferase (GGCT)/AIG2-like uncharacterized protein YtfP
MKYGLFYGSLKSGMYNFDRFGKGTQKYVKTVKLDGYELYNLGAYPGLTKGKGKVTFELHEVDDKAFEHIKQMELGAGYREETVNVDGIPATLYIYENKYGRLTDKDKVESGNWVEKPRKW